MKPCIVFVSFIMLAGEILVQATEPTKVLGRQTKSIAGWTLLISDELLEKDKAGTEQALELMTLQLQEITRVVPAAAVVELRKVPLWFSPEYANVQPRAEYHPDADTSHAKAVLKNLEKYYPGYQGQGYEVAGFVWWQGHKDQSAALASRYEQNLVHLIKSLRKDFNAPNAKFVLATGCGNPGRDGFGLQIAEAQLAVDGDKGKYPEFKGNVKAVDTRDLWREAEVSPVNQGYHYNHNAETCYETGDALGRAMQALLKETK